MWRPGGGFYRDVTLKEMTDKSHQIGRQVSLLPQQVCSIQSEIENFPYEALGKSVHITTTEVASHIAAGCTGAALNVLNENENLGIEKKRLFEELRIQRPFYDELVHAHDRIPTRGIFTGWNRDSYAVKGLSGSWVRAGAEIDPHFADQWFETGLPMAYGADTAQMAMFTGDAPYAFSEEELLRWLSAGVYMDGAALQAFNKLGYGEFTGFEVKGQLDADCIEQWTRHPLNGEYAGYLRNGRQSFWKNPCSILHPTSPDAQTLARAVDYANQLQAASVMGVFENRLGGRICIGGYFPWDGVLSHAKSEQCKRIARWLTQDKLPAYVSSMHKVNLWVREGRFGQKVLTLLSSSMDVAEGLTVKVLTGSGAMKFTDRTLHRTVIAASGQDGAYKVFVLPNLEPWNVYLATLE
jgi:hypothetical protein